MGVSLVVRAANHAWIVGETLRKIGTGQRKPDEILAIDWASTDGTANVLAKHADVVVRLDPADFTPGRALNRAVNMAAHEVVVLLNADCTPVDNQFLGALVAPILFGSADATFARQIAREDAQPIVVKDCEWAFGNGQKSTLWHRFFCGAACAFRTAILRDRPFAEHLRDSEDIEWFWAMKDRARIRFVPAAKVFHSTDRYRLRDTWKQFHGEGAADAQIFGDRVPANGKFLRALTAAANESLKDCAWALRRKELRVMLHSLPIRLAQRLAYWRGIRQITVGAKRERFAPLARLRRRRRPVLPHLDE